MSIQTSFNRIRRETGIKRAVVIEGNVGDVFLNDKKRIVTLKEYLMDMLKDMAYEDVIYWDRVDGVDGDLTKLDLVDDVEVKGDTYDFEDDDEEDKKTGSGLFKKPAEIFNLVFKNMINPKRKVAFVLNWADYLFGNGNQLMDDEREYLTLLGKAIKDRKVDYLSEDTNGSVVILIANRL